MTGATAGSPAWATSESCAVTRAWRPAASAMSRSAILRMPGIGCLPGRRSGPLPRLSTLLEQTLREVVLVDVADVVHRLTADLPGGEHLDVLKPPVGVEPGRAGLTPEPGDARRPGVVGGHGEDFPVQGGHGGVPIVPVDDEAQVLRPGAHVVLQLVHAGDIDRIAGGRRGLDLHDTHRAGGASTALVQSRLLVALRQQQQGIEIEFGAGVLE